MYESSRNADLNGCLPFGPSGISVEVIQGGLSVGFMGLPPAKEKGPSGGFAGSWPAHSETTLSILEWPPAPSVRSRTFLRRSMTDSERASEAIANPMNPRWTREKLSLGL
jgi:hypothetical protein